MNDAAASHRFWDDHPVAEYGPDTTTGQSRAAIDGRNREYPGLAALTQLHFPGKTVLDFGCGPGDDTIALLDNGAAHVYAADVSPRALASLRHRLDVHGYSDRCTTILIPPDESWEPPSVDHINAAGVLHHCADPVSVLRHLRSALMDGATIWAMVYCSESTFYSARCMGDPAAFRREADGGAPIAWAWTRDEFVAIARQAGLEARYLGSYHHFEIGGPGLSSCWSLSWDRPYENLLTCVVTHDRFPLTKRCVQSYLDTVGPRAMLVIVDNVSTDGTLDWLSHFVHVIRNDRNLYPGAACNQAWDYGINAGFAPALLHRSDNDIEYLPGWREEIERTIADWPEIALLGVLNLHEDRGIDGRLDHGIEPVPRVGGNVVMPARLFRAGLRWSDKPWSPLDGEDGPMSWDAARHGMVARLRRTVANNMAFGRAADFPDYYQETARVRGIERWETST